jgi:hypothetical protein
MENEVVLVLFKTGFKSTINGCLEESRAISHNSSKNGCVRLVGKIKSVVVMNCYAFLRDYVQIRKNVHIKY